MSNYLNFIYINLAFIIQIFIIVFLNYKVYVNNNWSTLKNSPMYWIFSDDIKKEFYDNVTNITTNLMGYLLQPLNYMTSSLTEIGSKFNISINSIRNIVSEIRTFVSNIIQSVMGVFLNMVIEFEKMVISIKDIVGKMVGVVMTIMYILDGSIKTMQSAVNGPFGQITSVFSACFHPETIVKLKNGKSYPMKFLPLGSELINGSKVYAIMKIANVNLEAFYKVNDYDQLHNPNPVYVTGNHFIFDKKNNKWTKVKNFYDAVIQREYVIPTLYCLITSDNKIPIGNHLFWDWEDDILTKYYNL